MATETVLDDEQGCRAASAGMAPSIRFVQWKRATDLLWDLQCHHHSQNHSSDCQRKPDRDLNWRNLNDYPQKQNPKTVSKWNLGILSAESLKTILFSGNGTVTQPLAESHSSSWARQKLYRDPQQQDFGPWVLQIPGSTAAWLARYSGASEPGSPGNHSSKMLMLERA